MLRVWGHILRMSGTDDTARCEVCRSVVTGLMIEAGAVPTCPRRRAMNGRPR